MSKIAAIGIANPTFSIDQSMSCSLLKEHYGDILRPRSLNVLEQVISHPSIQKRHIAVDNLQELLTLKNEDPDKRIERFTRWGTRLGAQAARKALDKAEVDIEDVSVLVVNTCTGYVCPGLSSYLIEELGLNAHVKAFDVVGLGCGGSVPNIDLAQSVLGDYRNGVALSIAIEICSATFQMGNDISLIVSNAIFGDGAAAAVIWNKESGLQLKDSRSYFDPGHREDVRYIHKNGQLYNRLSPHLPEIIGSVVPREIQNLCSDNSLATGDIQHWALHPGGHKMLEGIKAALRLPESAMGPSRKVLSEFGNMSSPSALFVLHGIQENGIEPGEWCCLIGYGAGLSVYSFLLQG